MSVTSRTVTLIAFALAVAAPPAHAQHGRLFPPADLTLLEAPDRDVWQRPDRIMDALGIGEGSLVADIGAGGGWFTIRLARRVGPNGKVFAQDIQPEMIGAIQRRVARENLSGRVQTVLGKANDPTLPEPVDAVLIADVYPEIEEPVVLLRNIARRLKPAGQVGIVNFTKDGGGPGPPMEDRVDPEQVIREAEQAGLVLLRRENFLRYQYMLVFGRADSAEAATRAGR